MFSGQARGKSNMALEMMLRPDEIVHCFRSSFRDWAAISLTSSVKSTRPRWRIKEKIPAGMGQPQNKAARTSRGPEKQYHSVLLLRRDNRYFTGGRPATLAGVGLFKHFGCPKPPAL